MKQLDNPTWSPEDRIYHLSNRCKIKGLSSKEQSDILEKIASLYEELALWNQQPYTIILCNQLDNLEDSYYDEAHLLIQLDTGKMRLHYRVINQCNLTCSGTIDHYKEILLYADNETVDANSLSQPKRYALLMEQICVQSPVASKSTLQVHTQYYLTQSLAYWSSALTLLEVSQQKYNSIKNKMNQLDQQIKQHLEPSSPVTRVQTNSASSSCSPRTAMHTLFAQLNQENETFDTASSLLSLAKPLT